MKIYLLQVFKLHDIENDFSMLRTLRTCFYVELLLPFAASNHVGPICRRYRYQHWMHVVLWYNQITLTSFCLINLLRPWGCHTCIMRRILFDVGDVYNLVHILQDNNPQHIFSTGGQHHHSFVPLREGYKPGFKFSADLARR